MPPHKVQKKGRQPSRTTRVKVLRWKRGGTWAGENDLVAREEPLEIRIRGHNVTVTMRTPGHDDELAAGYLCTEKIVRTRSDIKGIAPSRGSFAPENTLDVFLAPGVEVDRARLARHTYAASSCGLCGKASLDAIRQNFAPVDSPLTVSPAILAKLPRRMRRAQATFTQTGGLHAAAVFDPRGRLIVLREDIGRHNAVDKVIGHGLLNGNFPFASHLLLVSGRASLEIMQKSLAARFPIVCAVSAPSSLAVQFARESGQTLVGFLRDETMNVYSHPQRISA